MVKAAIKREQSDACISYAEREQVRSPKRLIKNFSKNLFNSEKCIIFATDFKEDVDC